MGKADLHIHTDQGDGYDSMSAILDQVAATDDLDLVSITEHDDISVALRARDLWAKRAYAFHFVPGIEVTTLQGHLVALYVEDAVPSLRPIEETIDAVRRQGGVCFVPHPMSWLTRSIGPGTLDRLLLLRDEGIWPDAIELASASFASRLSRAKATRLNHERYHLPSVGASDAHFARAVGSACTEFPGATAADLRAAFAAGNLRGHEVRPAGPAEVGWARWLALPVYGLRATPKKLGWRRTVWSFVSRYRA